MNLENIEIAKTWFVLAEILAVVAGLFLVSSGFFAISYKDILGSADATLNLCQKAVENNFSSISNLTVEKCMNEISSSINLANRDTQRISFFLMFLGFLLAMSSLLCWFIGRCKIENEDFPDKEYGILLIILFVIFIILIKFVIWGIVK